MASVSEGDNKGAVRLAAGDDTFLPPTLENKTLLDAKHPPAPADKATPQSNDCVQLQVSQSEVRRAVMSFNAGSAGGQTGLRPQHVKDALSPSANEAGNNLLSHLTDYTNLLLTGKIPAFIKPVVSSATLISLAKKCGGIRPIAIGDILRRLTSKCISRRMLEKFKDYFWPFQLGAGVKHGSEAAAHVARDFIECAERDQAFVKIDFANAFNSVRRDVILKAINEDAPEILSFVQLCYEHSSFLKYGAFTIKSTEGFQQGDPLATIGFCLVLHPALQNLLSKLKTGYLDDVDFADEWRTTLHDLLSIKQACEKLGLLLNEKKCEVTAFGSSKKEIERAFRETFPTIQCVGAEDSTLLGAGLCTMSIRAELVDKLAKLKTLLQRTASLPCQTAFFLIKNCFFVPKLMYVLRASPDLKHTDLLDEIDTLVCLELERIFNCIISDVSFSQICLPTKQGGFGLQKTSTLSSSAFIASFVSTENLRHRLAPEISNPGLFNEAVDHWESLSNHRFEDLAPQCAQKFWTKPIYEQQSANILSNCTDENSLARYHGCRAVGSGAWLDVLPSRPLGLTLSDDEFRISAGLRLGAPVTAQHTCKCGYVAATDGRHALVCPMIKHRFVRHSNGNMIIKDSIKSLGISSTLEPIGPLREDGRRPDGHKLMPWQRGRTLAWDFTCISRLANSNLRMGVLPGANAASEAEVRKRNHYSDLPSTVSFEPVAMETLGGAGRSTAVLLKELARRITVLTGEKLAFKFLKQKLDLAIQRGNAGCILEATN